MTGHKCDGGCRRAVRDRNAGISRHADSGGHARHDLEINSRCDERQSLFGSSTEHERVAPFEPDHLPPGPGMFDQEFIDLFLRESAVTDRLARAHLHGALRGHAEKAGACEMVVDDHVGSRQQVFAPAGEEPRVTWSGADQVNFSRALRRHGS